MLTFGRRGFWTNHNGFLYYKYTANCIGNLNTSKNKSEVYLQTYLTSLQQLCFLFFYSCQIQEEYIFLCSLFIYFKSSGCSAMACFHVGSEK